LTKEFPFVRHAMYTRLREIGTTLPNRSGSVLSISHSTNLISLMGLKATSVTEANYPDVNILNLPYPDESFDFVLSDQVYEHIEGNPQQATDECLRVLKPGGIMVHTTCFNMGYHGPGDYWRYTPEGLAYLCRNASRVIEASGWGHPFVFLFTFFGFVWEPAPAAKWHPMNWAATVRRASYDYVVWVVAQK
jgi:SAM-dependent methyltransferase